VANLWIGKSLKRARLSVIIQTDTSVTVLSVVAFSGTDCAEAGTLQCMDNKMAHNIKTRKIPRVFLCLKYHSSNV